MFSVKEQASSSVYSAKKAAIRSFTRCCPGFTNTPFLNNFDQIPEESQATVDNCRKQTLMNRLAQPEEIAKSVLFLASDKSSYITGIELFADDGFAQV